MIEPRWDQERVARRLEEAVDVLARLPEERVRGFYDLWPRLVGEPSRSGQPAAAAPRRSTGWTRRWAGCAGWSPMSGGWCGCAPRACRGSASLTGSDRPDHRVAALDDRPAQDLGPAERSLHEQKCSNINKLNTQAGTVLEMM